MNVLSRILENLYVVFAVRPYHENIARSSLEESKYYFCDTGAVGDGRLPEGELLRPTHPTWRADVVFAR